MFINHKRLSAISNYAGYARISRHAEGGFSKAHFMYAQEKRPRMAGNSQGKQYVGEL